MNECKGDHWISCVSVALSHQIDAREEINEAEITERGVSRLLQVVPPAVAGVYAKVLHGGRICRGCSSDEAFLTTWKLAPICRRQALRSFSEVSSSVIVFVVETSSFQNVSCSVP